MVDLEHDEYLREMARYRLGTEHSVKLALIMLAFILLPFLAVIFVLLTILQWGFPLMYLLVICPIVCGLSSAITAILYKNAYETLLVKKMNQLRNEDSLEEIVF